ncbi:MAG: hypothetical protein B7Y39_02440 [Bdellovibrio sp. 28-41-41]|nr:MAG: hypothetical protein B7Y39_02440 [Bdellovibrio sp. 28-41-41]
MKFAVVLGLLSTSILCLTSCQKFDASTAPSPEIVTDKNQIDSASRPNVAISFSEVQLGECMSLALLVERLSDPMFDYPSAKMVTDFHVLDETVSSGNAKFLAYSSFYYRVAPAKELVPFTKAYQSDCKTLKLTMASGHILTYNILESSDRHLKFRLTSEFGDEVPNYQRDALFKRYQPEEISVQLVSESEIKLSKKIKSFDPFCKKKKKGYEVRVTEVFSWKIDQAELPGQYQIEKGYLELVISALKTPPELDAEKPVSIATVKDVMTAPVLDEIKLCE